MNLNPFKTFVKIRYKFFVPTLLLVIFSTTISVFFFYTQSQDVLYELKIKELTEKSQQIETQFSNWLQTQKIVLEKMGKVKKMAQGLKKGSMGTLYASFAKNMFIIRVDADPQILNMKLIDLTGQIKTSNLPIDEKEKNISEKIYFKQAISVTEATILPHFFFNTETQSINFYISVPVKKDDKTIGIILTQINFKKFTDENISPIKIGTRGFPFIISKDLDLMSYPDKIVFTDNNAPQLATVQNAVSELLKKEDHIMFSAWGGFDKITYYHEIPKSNFVVVVFVCTDEILAPLTKAAKVSMVILFIVIVLTSIIIWFVSLSISNPIIKTVQFIENFLSKGQLRKRIEFNTNDEVSWMIHAINHYVDILEKKVDIADRVSIGELNVEVDVISDDDSMGRALKRMMDNLNDVFYKIIDQSSSLANSSEDLFGTSKELASATNEIALQSDEVSQASEEMNNNISSMAAGIEEMSANIQSVSATSTEMSHNMNNMATSMDGLAEAINGASQSAGNAMVVSKEAQQASEKASGIMSSLSKSAKEIDEVTVMIKEIAQQTNLLALNANIEAASAGEAGKGFAVVANEIKELAKQSSTSAEDITQKISEIQKNSGESEKSMGVISDIIGEISHSSEDITKLSSKGAEMVNMLNANVKESASGSEEIAKLIEEMLLTSKESAKSAANVSSNSTKISNNVGKLHEVISKTSGDVDDVNDEAKALSKLAENLKNLITTFKLKERS